MPSKDKQKPGSSRVEKTCLECHEVFFVFPSRRNRRFCSHVCAVNYNWRNNQNCSAHKKKDKVCKQCGTRFTKPANHKKAIFCSEQCRLDWIKEHRQCPDCGKERCKLHAREKSRKWQAAATKKERKARSMQISFRHASNETLPLKDARALIEDPPICNYCKLQIPWHSLSIDHKIPKSRGGSDTRDNLAWCDYDCNIMKGNLTDSEFIALLAFLNEHPDIKRLLTTRLKISGFVFRKTLLKHSQK